MPLEPYKITIRYDTQIYRGYKEVLEELKAHPNFARCPSLIDNLRWEIIDEDDGILVTIQDRPVFTGNLCNACEDLESISIDINKHHTQKISK